MNSVWIVDDDESIRWVLERALTREGFDVRAFASAGECLDALDDDSPQVLISDIRMPEVTGIELLQQFRLRRPATPVIIMTAYSDLDSAVSALQGGAFEYLPKPFDLSSAIELVHRALDEGSREGAAADETEARLDMLGQAPAMQDVFRAIGRLSQSSATVLITGESGTGKELVARALHKHSPRAAESFVALNTAAIPRDLLESELFGHERGAFTGAQQLRRGRFEQARGGTLFLDEIGDMPPEMQTRLLRVLSDGQYYRVGGHQPQQAQARVIAATHQNLEERVQRGLFREDLFHRLNVIRLRLPPLRERREDIPVLVRHFLQRSARDLGGEPKRLSAAALRRMTEYAWPGNVRQLENSCHWLTVMAPSIVVDLRDLPPEIRLEPSGEEGGSVASPPGASGAPAMGGSTSGARSGESLASPESPSDHVHASPFAPVPSAAFMNRPAVDFPTAAPSGDRGTQNAAASPGAAPVVAATATRDHPAKPASASAPAPAGEADAGTVPSAAADEAHWEHLLEQEVAALLTAQSACASTSGELMDRLTREFEATVIATALRHTGGRRIEAAHRLGIGRNTITRKIQQLRLDDPPQEAKSHRERERS